MEYACIQYTRYHDSLVSEFFWKLENIVDVLRGRATREVKFKEAQASNVLNLVQNAGSIGAAVASTSGILLSFLGDVKESRKSNILSPEILSGQWQELRNLVTASASLAVHRYSLFLKSLSEADAVELGQISAQRIWTHLSDHQLPFSTDNLLQGILQGKSGRWEDDWRNTGISVEAESRRCTAEGALKHGGIAYTDSSGQWHFYLHPRDKGVVQFPKYKFMLLPEAEARDRVVRKKYVAFSPTPQQLAAMLEHWAAPVHVPTNGRSTSANSALDALDARLQKLRSDFLSFEEWRVTLQATVLSIEGQVQEHSQQLGKMSVTVSQVIAALPELNQTIQHHAAKHEEHTSQLAVLTNKVHKFSERSFTYIPRPYYQPREAPYEALVRRVQDHSSAPIAVVGSGGVGKTTLVSQFLHAQRDTGRYHRILRMAMDSASIEASLVDLCRELHITTKDRKQEDWLPEVSFRLMNQSWLIVWDNVDSASSLDHLLSFFVTQPTRDANCPQDLIITTRNAFGWVDPVLVEVYSEREAVCYIKHQLTAAGSPFFKADEALALAEVLGYHPLAVELAVGDLCVFQQSMSAFLSTLKAAGLKSLNGSKHRVVHVGRVNENSLQTLWQLSLQRLSEDAIQLLRVMSFCSADGASGIFLALFLPSEDSSRYKEALFALRQQSLVKPVSHSTEQNTTESGSVGSADQWVVHRLLQDVVRSEALKEWKKGGETNKLSEFLENFVLFLKTAFFDPVEAEPRKMKRARVREGTQHGSHFYACTLLIDDKQTFVGLPTLQARLLDLVGDQESLYLQHYQEGKKHFLLAIALFESLPGSDMNADLVHALNNYGACFLALEAYTEGLTAVNRSIALLPPIINALENDVQKIDAINMLVNALQLQSGIYLRMCEYEQSTAAMLSADSVLEAFASLLANSRSSSSSPVGDPVFLISRLTIQCNICLAKGKYTQALEFNNAVLSILLAAPNKNELVEAIASKYGTAASIYAQQGMFIRAHQQYTLAINEFKREYGENYNHPSIALLWNSIGKLYMQRRDPQAKQYCLKALAMFEALGITMSKELANTLGNLSQYAYSVEGDFAAANEYGTRAYGILQEMTKFNCKSTLTATICTTLASIARSSGDIASAREYSQAALRASYDIYGEDAVHEDIAMAYSSLGMNEYEDKQYDKAKHYFATAMQMCVAYWGEQTPHHQLSDLHINLGGVACDQRRNEDARKHYKAALHILMALGMPRNHPDVHVCVVSLEALDRAEGAGSHSCTQQLLCLVCCPCNMLRWCCGGCPSKDEEDSTHGVRAQVDRSYQQGAQIQAMFDELMRDPLEEMMASAMQRMMMERQAAENTVGEEEALQQPLLANEA